MTPDTTQDVNVGAVFSSIAEGLFKLAPPPFDFLGTAILAGLDQQPVTDYISQLTPVIQNIVATQAVNSVITEASTYVGAYIDALKLTPKDKMYAFLSAQESNTSPSCLFMAVETLKYLKPQDPILAATTLNQFIAGASLNLTNVQSMLALSDSTEDAQTLMGLIAQYRSYLSLAFNTILTERMKAITMTVDPTENSIYSHGTITYYPGKVFTTISDTVANVNDQYTDVDSDATLAQYKANIKIITYLSLVDACNVADAAWAHVSMVCAAKAQEASFSVPLSRYNTAVNVAYAQGYTNVTITNVRVYQLSLIYTLELLVNGTSTALTPVQDSVIDFAPANNSPITLDGSLSIGLLVLGSTLTPEEQKDLVCMGIVDLTFGN